MLRAELGMHPLKTSRDMIELKRQLLVPNTTKKRFAAVIDTWYLIVLYGA